MSHEKDNYLNIELSAKCEKFTIIFQLVTQNDLIDHSNKDNPIVPHYQFNNIVLENTDKLYLVYNFQFIKYETDNGIIFSNQTTVNGVGFYGSNPFDRVELGNKKLNIDFRMNFANYDYYNRAFIKFQSFLADVMSLINLLITISKVVTEFLLYKKMHKDIIKYIITSNNNIKENKIGKEIFQNKLKSKKIFDIYDCKGEKFEKK